MVELFWFWNWFIKEKKKRGHVQYAYTPCLGGVQTRGPCCISAPVVVVQWAVIKSIIDREQQQLNIMI